MPFTFDDPSIFEVTTSLEEGRTVLSLHGRVENLAAFDLGRVFGCRH